MKKLFFVFSFIILYHSSFAQQLELNLEQAQKIFELPKHCIQVEYPNKLGNTLGSDKDLKNPKQIRPIFYGCFDWHSSVHGFWSMIYLLKKFPDLDQNKSVRMAINQMITPENVAVEMAFFDDFNNRHFERTYGWAWLLTLQMELNNWDDMDVQVWAKSLKPFSDLIVQKYKEYLPKLLYPIRTGKHDNIAFGLSLAMDYARSVDDKEFEKIISDSSKRFFLKDKKCPLDYEPSGNDFLSPCLEEALVMSKVLNKSDFVKWLHGFMPGLFKKDFKLERGIVADRTDGQLVHLDGVNFSRATALYQISEQIPEIKNLRAIADKHLTYSLGNITNDDYMGSHWLGTFALYALKSKK